MRIVIAPHEPDCVHWIASHVESDLDRLAAAGQTIPLRIVAGPSNPRVIALLDRFPQLPHFEGFVIDRVPDDTGTLVVASRHHRGTMLGLLEVTRLLGVDPLEYFTDVPPEAAPLDRLTFPILSPERAFRYRGIFINQEDLLAGWQNDRGPIPMEVFDQIFLMVLRLGGNMILPGTYLSTDSPILEHAASRGLVLAQHHFQIAGTDVGRLTPREREQYSFVRFPDATMDVWRQSIRRNRHRETVWTLGYRGVNDQPFWQDEPGEFSDRDKGRIISAAIRAQLQLLKEELGTEDAPCVFYLYRENQILYQRGFMEIPASVCLVWCDNGYGTMESYFRGDYELWGMTQMMPIPSAGDVRPAWPAQAQPGHGVYYHVSFYDGFAPSRTQYVSPAKIQTNLSKAHALGLDRFMLLNVGNMREFVLGIATAFDFARDPRPWLADPDHSRLFIEHWCARRVSKEAAAQAADSYLALYAAHWWWSRTPGKCFGDNAVTWMLKDCLAAILGHVQPTRLGEYVAPGVSLDELISIIADEGHRSLLRWEQALAVAEELHQNLPIADRRFFWENVVVQTQRGVGASGVVAMASRAILALRRQNESACRQAWDRALHAMNTWEQALAAADRKPKWSTWSRADRIVQPHVARHYLNAIEPMIEAAFAASKNDLHEHLKRGSAHEIARSTETA